MIEHQSPVTSLRPVSFGILPPNLKTKKCLIGCSCVRTCKIQIGGRKWRTLLNIIATLKKFKEIQTSPPNLRLRLPPFLKFLVSHLNVSLLLELKGRLAHPETAQNIGALISVLNADFLPPICRSWWHLQPAYFTKNVQQVNTQFPASTNPTSSNQVAEERCVVTTFLGLLDMFKLLKNSKLNLCGKNGITLGEECSKTCLGLKVDLGPYFEITYLDFNAKIWDWLATCITITQSKLL